MLENSHLRDVEPAQVLMKSMTMKATISIMNMNPDFRLASNHQIIWGICAVTPAKVNGRCLKNRQPTFNFNGKTNSKGVAKYVIKSTVLKKLNAGKKITYQAIFLKDVIKKSAKVLK